jgi:hypothetical protein
MGAETAGVMIGRIASRNVGRRWLGPDRDSRSPSSRARIVVRRD